jgi:hypothetical protein
MDIDEYEIFKTCIHPETFPFRNGCVRLWCSFRNHYWIKVCGKMPGICHSIRAIENDS